MIHVLTVCDNVGRPIDWFFDEHPHFLRAKRYAEERGIYVTDREDYITDLSEFRAWVNKCHGDDDEEDHTGM